MRTPNTEYDIHNAWQVKFRMPDKYDKLQLQNAHLQVMIEPENAREN
jgi:hypothetical protein